MKDVKDYMKLPYNIVTKYIDEGDGYYYGKVLELDGCQSTGNTIEVLYKNIKEAMQGWIETKLENGYNIPTPL